MLWRPDEGASLRDGLIALGFFSIAHHPVTGRGVQLGCERDTDGCLVVDASGATTVPGVFAAGEVTSGLQLVQVAAGSGAIAGVGCALSLETIQRPHLRSLPTPKARSRSSGPEPELVRRSKHYR